VFVACTAKPVQVVEEVDLAAGGADLTGDRMRCVGGRQAAFDPWGAELLYLRADPDRAVVRRLRTGEEYEVRAPSRMVWRAEPTGAPGWVRFHVVPRDTDGDGALTDPRLCAGLRGGGRPT